MTTQRAEALPAVPTLLIDNERVRVTEWRFAPAAATGWHRHEFDYVVVPLVTGQLRVESATAEVLADLVEGEPYFRNAGAEHNVKNANPYEFAFIEVETKA